MCFNNIAAFAHHEAKDGAEWISKQLQRTMFHTLRRLKQLSGNVFSKPRTTLQTGWRIKCGWCDRRRHCGSQKAGESRVGEGDELGAEGRRRRMAGEVAVEVNTQIVMSWATISNVP